MRDPLCHDDRALRRRDARTLPAIMRMQWLMVLSGALALIGAVWFVWRLG
ncbi:MAG: hypothetical protein ACJ8FU_11945 [Xanthobacteraceae bacterium]|jgi:hypothetical protein